MLRRLISPSPNLNRPRLLLGAIHFAKFGGYLADSTKVTFKLFYFPAHSTGRHVLGEYPCPFSTIDAVVGKFRHSHRLTLAVSGDLFASDVSINFDCRSSLRPFSSKFHVFLLRS
jgi:hypothetical protein